MKPGTKPTLRAIDGGLSKVPPAPKTLGPEAREEWRRAASELIALRVLAKSDLPALEGYAAAKGMVRKLTPVANAAPPIIVNEKSGAVKKHPAHVMLTNYLGLCIRYEGELGLTPASRNRKSMQPRDGESDPWGEFDL